MENIKSLFEEIDKNDYSGDITRIKKEKKLQIHFILSGIDVSIYILGGNIYIEIEKKYLNNIREILEIVSLYIFNYYNNINVESGMYAKIKKKYPNNNIIGNIDINFTDIDKIREEYKKELNNEYSIFYFLFGSQDLLFIKINEDIECIEGIDIDRNDYIQSLTSALDKIKENIRDFKDLSNNSLWFHLEPCQRIGTRFFDNLSFKNVYMSIKKLAELKILTGMPRIYTDIKNIDKKEEYIIVENLDKKDTRYVLLAVIGKTIKRTIFTRNGKWYRYNKFKIEETGDKHINDNHGYYYLLKKIELNRNNIVNHLVTNVLGANADSYKRAFYILDELVFDSGIKKRINKKIIFLDDNKIKNFVVTITETLYSIIIEIDKRKTEQFGQVHVFFKLISKIISRYWNTNKESCVLKYALDIDIKNIPIQFINNIERENAKNITSRFWNWTRVSSFIKLNGFDIVYIPKNTILFHGTYLDFPPNELPRNKSFYGTLETAMYYAFIRRKNAQSGQILTLRITRDIFIMKTSDSSFNILLNRIQNENEREGMKKTIKALYNYDELYTRISIPQGDDIVNKFICNLVDEKSDFIGYGDKKYKDFHDELVLCDSNVLERLNYTYRFDMDFPYCIFMLENGKIINRFDSRTLNNFKSYYSRWNPDRKEEIRLEELDDKIETDLKTECNNDKYVPKIERIYPEWENTENL